MDGTIGYCPIPSMKVMKNWTSLEDYTHGNSTNCHTLDRYNTKAHYDCGIGPSTTLA